MIKLQLPTNTYLQIRSIHIAITLLLGLLIAYVSFIVAIIVLLFGVSIFIASLLLEPKKSDRLFRVLIAVLTIVLTVVTLEYMLFFVVAYMPLSPVQYKATLKQSQSDENLFLVNEEFTVAMRTRSPRNDTEYQGIELTKPITIEDISANMSHVNISILSNRASVLTTPFELEPVTPYIVATSRTITSTNKGFLVKEVAFSPTSFVYHYSQSPKLLTAAPAQLSLFRAGRSNELQELSSGPLAEVELTEFPKNSYWGTNLPSDTLTYGNTIIVRWRFDARFQIPKFLYISRPYNSLRFILTPILGITAFSEFFMTLIGIAIPFIVGIVFTIVSDALRQSTQSLIDRLKQMFKIRSMKQEQRRKTLEKILPKGVSVEEYLKKEKEKKHK